jgi:hypothetical protein
VQIYGDFLLVHTSESVDVAPIDFGALPAKDWASTDRSAAAAARATSTRSAWARA